MLLRLVGCKDHHALLSERVFTSGLGEEESSEGVDAWTGETPFLTVPPFEFLANGLCHAPAVGEAELGEHGAGSGQAKVLDEILSQDPHGHGVDQERSLAGKTDDTPLRVQLQQLVVMQIFDAHESFLSK
jgi:hypothetical protein